ncbi:hypothetical protein ES319_A10G063400v1 [Gossypium barbadense]|uniref:Uncharacterized protein n=2 Tax=Gossypium TaxID=3633 RepID=A0A5J5TZQ9_GOSBA|nr:hypothetical protein ES319_A10G063400v1 [Gossypium barbadense]TYG97820.1 hypothetical protein ES288_A10G068000v1 [Gossypium darwinii]
MGRGIIQHKFSTPNTGVHQSFSPSSPFIVKICTGVHLPLLKMKTRDFSLLSARLCVSFHNLPVLALPCKSFTL